MNILTLDIEDWCQSSADLLQPKGRPVERPIPPSERVLGNTRRLLALLAAHEVRATCFVLGTVADAYPELVREIQGAGHEVASHGWGHDPVYRLSREELAADVERSISVLRGITGERVLGYRAPYFSIAAETRWALEVLAELRLTYDSSTYPIHRGFYGFYPGWRGGSTRRFPHRLELANGSHLIELPCSTVRCAGLRLPIGSGGMLRMVPMSYVRAAIRSLNAAGRPAIFYLHPFDLDAVELRGGAPGDSWRIRTLRWLLNFNRAGNAAKLCRLLRELHFTSVREWLASSSFGSEPCRDARAVSAG